jgi:hypothetical protein
LTKVAKIEYRGVIGFDPFSPAYEATNAEKGYIVQHGNNVLNLLPEAFGSHPLYTEQIFKEVVDNYLDNGIIPEGTRWVDVKAASERFRKWAEAGINEWHKNVVAINIIWIIT